jgi:CBS-domain-containing membrane protein
MKILAENNVLSLPVRDADEASYVGWFGVMEALSFILRTYAENEDKENKNWIWCKDIDKLIHKGEAIGKVPIKAVMDKKWVQPVSGIGSLFELVELFSTSRIHRVGVLKDENDSYLRSIATQSDVIHMLSKKIYDTPLCLGTEIHLPIGNFESLRKNSSVSSPIAMSFSATTIHAFWLMVFHKVYGIAITDSNGRLIADISATDVKGLSEKLPFSSLLLPIRDFARKSNVRPAVKCTWETPLSSIIHQLSLFRAHRVWVVDSNDIPVGVVTLSTIMDFLNGLVKI